jgi:acyl-CoA synthetase (AMP-forming)/AMP-acid ligase II
MLIIDQFDNGARFYPDNPAFIDIGPGGTTLTYNEALPITHRIAAAIHANGYDESTHIGILAPNSTIAFLTLLGLFRAGAVWLPINPRNPVPANAELLEAFDGELIFYHSAFEEAAKALVEQTPGLKEAVCIDNQGSYGTNLEDWWQDAPEEFERPAAEADGLFAIFPTGGTTGKPKGVMVNHLAVDTLFNNFYSHFSYHDDTCHLVVAPMTHTAGVTGCMHFARGGANVLMAVPSPEAICQAIQDYRVTHLFLPPTLLYMLLALPNVRDYDYSSLQHFLIGAAPTSLDKLKEAIGVFGPVMTEAFGQTEAPASITLKAPWDYMDSDGAIDDKRLQSIGRPGVNNTVAILDDDGNEVERGVAGEICIKGDLVTPGYYKNPEATAEVRRSGWHLTGDIGVMDGDGFITIVDRKKDMIITGGFNVFPNEVEQVLNSHPAVLDCAVIGVPDEKWGESVKGVVQLKPETECSEQDLIDLCKRELGSVKAPKSIDFSDDLPRSPTGKVLKTEIRRPYWKERTRGIN